MKTKGTSDSYCANIWIKFEYRGGLEIEEYSLRLEEIECVGKSITFLQLVDYSNCLRRQLCHAFENPFSTTVFEKD